MLYNTFCVLRKVPTPVPEIEKICSERPQNVSTPSNTIWVLTNFSDMELHEDVEKLIGYMETKTHCDNILIINEPKLIMKMDTHGLKLFYEEEEIQAPRVVLCRVSSSTLQVDQHITLLRQLELMGSIIVNSIDSIMKCTNKIWHLQELAHHGIPVPLTLTSTNKNPADFNTVQQSLQYPIVMKSVRGNFGKGVFLVTTPESQQEISAVLKKKCPYLYQEYIRESHGRDICVVVVNNKVMFTMIQHALDKCFRANSDSIGGTAEIITGRFTDIEEMALEIANILGLVFCSINFLFSETYGVVCYEVNNNPIVCKPIYEGHGITQAIGDYILNLT
jgi:RimK family alpha-L-glutamate ligase